jgi:hypothetical protein
MSMQGVQGNLLELINSPDKKLQDLLNILKAGDVLKGRVVDLLPADNKAIINFKGINVIAELPVGSQIAKGDIINVQVSQLGDKIFMKLIQGNPALTGLLDDMGANGQVSAEQISNLLSAIKVPVNQQNVFISQKLIDYQLPVTRENITEINNALVNFMAQKGITPSDLSGALASVSTNSTQQKEDALISMLQINAKLTADAAVIADKNTSAEAAIILKQSSAVKLLNMINTVNVSAKASPEVGVDIAGRQVVLNIANVSPQALSAFLAKVVEQKLLNSAEAQAVENSNGADISAQNNTVISYRNNSLQVEFPAMSGTLKSVIPGAAAGNGDISAKLFETAIANNTGSAETLLSRQGTAELAVIKELFENVQQLTQANSGAAQDRADAVQAQAAPASLGVTEQVAQSVTPAVQNNNDIELINTMAQARNLQSLIPVPAVPDINTGNASNPVATAKDIAGMLNKLSAELNFITLQQDNFTAPADSAALKQSFQDASSFINDFLAENGQRIAAGMASNAEAGDFVSAAAGLLDDKIVSGPVNTVTNTPPSITKFDVESAIESLAFLKSRELPLDNPKFTDMMSKYFGTDMKLNQSAEALNQSLSRLQPMTKDISANAAGLKDSVDAVKKLLGDMSLKPGNAGSEDMENQIKNFIDKSGINLEYKVRDMLTAVQDRKTADIQDLQAQSPGPAAERQKAESLAAVLAGARQDPSQSIKENLKSALIKLSSDMDGMDQSKLSSSMSKAVGDAKDAVRDMLTNLNALQFINQKPISFEMLYTQIPVLIDNKFFNGEIQVWYRKGSLKENLDNSDPVNIVFMLNTSKLGNVKIRMTIYKKDVECTVFAESEKAKQILTRQKTDFLGNVGSLDFNMKAFSIQMEGSGNTAGSPAAEGYISLGRVNFTA